MSSTRTVRPAVSHPREPLVPDGKGSGPEDRRVRDLIRLIDAGAHDVLSLDVFDTFVWRKVPAPVDVFFLIGRRLLASGAMRASSSAASFARERISAEERARKKIPSGEVTLAEIYHEFPAGYLCGVSPMDVAAIEFETEKDVVHVHAGMTDLLAHARARGMRTAFVSDTYFTSAQIRELTGVSIDHVIVSSEHRISKYHGLHRVLLEESRVRPERILHAGDSYPADIEGPAAFGIERFWFRKTPDEFKGCLEEEIPSTLSRRSEFLVGLDHGVTSLRGRAMFSCDGSYERWGAGVLGPVVAGFSDWVISRAQEEGIPTALCLMREGRILKRVIDAQRSGLDAREFYVSRFAALKASIFDGSEEEIRRFVFRPTPQKRGVILGQLGLASMDDPDRSDEVMSPRQLVSLIREIAGSRRMRDEVIRSSATHRAGLLRHLRPLVPSGGKVAIVDLGYKGTIQECLQRILDHEGIPLRTHGLYLVTGGDVHETQATGAVVEGWLAENGQPIGMAHTFMRSPEIVEQSLMADCGTTIGHKQDGSPVLDAFHIAPRQREDIAAIQKGIMTYASLWAEHKLLHDIRDPANAIPKPLYEAICTRAIARPSEAEIGLFQDWSHDENFGSKEARRLITVVDLGEWEESHISAHQIASLPSSKVYWPFGYASRIGPTLGEAVAQIYLRMVEPETFDLCEPPRPMIFYWDSGQGFNRAESNLHEYRLNNRGKVWRRFSLNLSNGSIHAVGFTIGFPGEIVQMNGAIVRLHPDTGEPHEMRLCGEEMQSEGARRLYSGLHLITSDPSLFIVPTGRVEDFTGKVDVDVFFSIVPGGAEESGAEKR
jgi:predicted HAD superfamily hydrolase